MQWNGYDLFQVVEAVLQCSIDRSTLLMALDRAVVAALPLTTSPKAQIFSDLCELCHIGVLPDGTVPLDTWLETAAYMAEPRSQAAVIRSRRDLLLPLLPQNRRPQKTSDEGRTVKYDPGDPLRTALIDVELLQAMLKLTRPTSSSPATSQQDAVNVAKENTVVIPPALQTLLLALMATNTDSADNAVLGGAAPLPDPSSSDVRELTDAEFELVEAADESFLTTNAPVPRCDSTIAAQQSTSPAIDRAHHPTQSHFQKWEKGKVFSLLALIEAAQADGEFSDKKG